MNRSTSRRAPGAAAMLLVTAALLSPLPASLSVGTAAGDGTSLRDTLRFAADMARRGNWREAKFRWTSALERRPGDPRLLNNLAIAHEALGEWDEAGAAYELALERLGNDDRVRENWRRHERFRHRVLASDDDDDSTDDVDDDSRADEESSDDVAAAEARREQLAARSAARGKGKGKTFRVNVELPVPPKLDVSEYDRLLVASFLHDESALLDINRELVRYLRGRLRRTPGLEVLDISPPPAIPEQTLEDLSVNREFWRHLGREYETGLVVSGRVTFTRSDVSGFRDVDVVSPVTGQKIRQSRFVEQEEFDYAVDVLFFDGATGDLLVRDRFQRAAVFRGANNDPITAFYELSDSVAADIVGVVRSRTRDDVRFVFRE